VEELIAVYPGKITGVALFRDEHPVEALELAVECSGLYFPPDEVACCNAIESLTNKRGFFLGELLIETWPTAWNAKQARFNEVAVNAWQDAAVRMSSWMVVFVNKRLRRSKGDKGEDSYSRDLRLGVQAARALNVDLARITRPIAEAIDLGLLAMSYPGFKDFKEITGFFSERIENRVSAVPQNDSKDNR